MFNLASNSMTNNIQSPLPQASETHLSSSPFDQIMVVEEVSPNNQNEIEC
jgi:hypothetical protein